MQRLTKEKIDDWCKKLPCDLNEYSYYGGKWSVRDIEDGAWYHRACTEDEILVLKNMVDIFCV